MVVEYVRLVDEASKNPDGSVIPDEIAKYHSEAQEENYLLLITTLEEKGVRVVNGETRVVFSPPYQVSDDLKTVSLSTCLDGSSLEHDNPSLIDFSPYVRSVWQLYRLDDGWILTEGPETKAESCG